MKAILFGATGMVGRGVLQECLVDPQVTAVLAVGRASCGVTHAKLKEIVRKDLFDLSAVRADLSGYDACFFCLGVSSAGMKEDAYRRVTYDLTLSVARTLREVSPAMTFCYVTGTGTDSTERGRSMWARVKGKTENDLLKLGFKAAYMFRPGYIQPVKGVTSKTRIYRLFYSALAPLYPVWKTILPGLVTTTEKLGRAMIHVVVRGYERPVLESRDINKLAE